MGTARTNEDSIQGLSKSMSQYWKEDRRTEAWLEPCHWMRLRDMGFQFQVGTDVLALAPRPGEFKVSTLMCCAESEDSFRPNSVNMSQQKPVNSSFLFFDSCDSTLSSTVFQLHTLPRVQG